MRISGLDLSMSCTGISLPEGNTVAYRPRTQGDARLNEIADMVYYSVADSGLVVIEDVPATMKGAAGAVVPMLHGAVRYRLQARGVPYMVLSPATLKKFATGKGNADKTAMALEALKRLGREYRTADECDADWLRVAGRIAYGLDEQVPGGPLRLPQDQIRALHRTSKGQPIVWPMIGGRTV